MIIHPMFLHFDYFRIFWCEGRFDCNTSSMNTTRIVDAEGLRVSVTIKNAARHHERLLHCVAENQYGRSMTAAIHLSYMGKVNE